MVEQRPRPCARYSLAPIQYLLNFNMAISHFPATLLFSFLVSTVFGVLSKNSPLARLAYGAKVFAAFVGIALVLGWIMYPAP